MYKHLRFSFNTRYAAIAALALFCIIADASCVAAATRNFDALSFFKKNTTFFEDFGAFRKQWFSVEERISSIKNEHEQFDWLEVRNSAKDVVARHEQLMVKFARDCRTAKAKLSKAEGAHAQRAIEPMLEYLDNVGLVVLKLYEIAEKLYGKTLDPYSYTMEDYNGDFRKFKELNDRFEKKGKEINLLLYGKTAPSRN